MALTNTEPIRSIRGFSLVELCIMFALIMLVLAFAISSLSSAMRGMQLSADARNIASAVNDAKLSATSQMRRYRVMFTLGEVQQFNSTSNQFESDLEENNLSTGSGITFKTTSSNALTGYPLDSSSAVSFNSRGIPIDDAGIPTSSNVSIQV
jgi:Tfp pilus assembly protein FimT